MKIGVVFLGAYDRIIEETIKEITYLEEQLLINDEESSSKIAKKAKLTIAYKA